MNTKHTGLENLFFILVPLILKGKGHGLFNLKGKGHGLFNLKGHGLFNLKGHLRRSFRGLTIYRFAMTLVINKILQPLISLGL